jgi:hypothetical protein
LLILQKDKASIVTDTINYIKELEKKVSVLQSAARSSKQPTVASLPKKIISKTRNSRSMMQPPIAAHKIDDGGDETDPAANQAPALQQKTCTPKDSAEGAANTDPPMPIDQAGASATTSPSIPQNLHNQVCNHHLDSMYNYLEMVGILQNTCSKSQVPVCNIWEICAGTNSTLS